MQLVVDGKINYIVECNPRFGPAAFDTLEAYAAGEEIAPMIINQDRDYTAENAAEGLASAY